MEKFFLVLNGFCGGENESSLGGISQVSERERAQGPKWAQWHPLLPVWEISGFVYETP